MTQYPPRQFLRALFDAAVQSAQPSACLPGHLPPFPNGGRLIVLSIGKAGAGMAKVAEEHYKETAPDAWKDGRILGVTVTRKGFTADLERFSAIEAGHPVPDHNSVAASEAVISLANQATADDHVLVLLSGGGSALLTAPAKGLTLADKQAITKDLLRCGAPISEINIVRKHLSLIKGGRLQRHIAPARSTTLAISDVAHDIPSAIASGPTVPDPHTLSDANNILSKFAIEPSHAVSAALADPNNETPKPGDSIFANVVYEIVASARIALDTAANMARMEGLDVIDLGDTLEDEARSLGHSHAVTALEILKSGKPTLLLSGGEAGVIVRGNGKGGPNQEFALSLALALNGAENVYALAADTDGTDGGVGNSDDPAGAFISPETLVIAKEQSLDGKAFLNNNDSTNFFRSLGDLLETGPTHTNVNDFRAVLINPPWN